MKKLLFLFLLTLSPMLASADANQNESLYCEWWLVGWNDGGIYYEVDTNHVSHRNLSIEIPREGYVMAYSMANKIFVGLLTLNGNNMLFDGEMRGVMTAVYCDAMENRFFENHICDIKSYQLEGKRLKLYYTDSDYFVFTSNIEETQNDYISFVNMGKQWNVVSTVVNSNSSCHFERYRISEEIERDSKTYFKVLRSEDDLSVIQACIMHHRKIVLTS